MTTGIIKRTTPNFSFRIPFFDAPNWGRELERNFDTVDAVLFAATGFSNVKGVWTNDTEYDAGDRVVDPADGSVWQSNVDHTSAATGTFLDDRTAHPTYWTQLNQTFANRGQWTTATNYNINEFVYDDHRYGVVMSKYTSGASYSADVAANKLLTLIDLKTAYDNTQTASATAVAAASTASTAAGNASTSETNAAASAASALSSKNAAATSATNAATSATNAGTSETNAAASATAANTSKVNAATSETNAAASAAAALTSKNNAATSETNAAASAAAAAANVAPAIHAATAKTLLAANDELGLADSAASYGIKKSLFSDLVWQMRCGIGQVYVVDTSKTGAEIPPSTTTGPVFIELTAGLTGVGNFNNGKLTSESVTGSAPLVLATATINLASSPMNGQVIDLLNTEGRILRPSTSAGTKQDDQSQGHGHNFVVSNGQRGVGSPSGTVDITSGGGSPATLTDRVTTAISDGTNGTPRVGTENRMKNVGVKAYMRIK